MNRAAVRRAIAGCLLGMVAASAVTIPAHAHNVLFGTSPANGSTVGSTPSRVVLTFDRPALALGTELVVTGPAGQEQTGKPVLVDNTVTQAVAAGAPAGNYTVAWRVTSADGHPINGTFSFASKHKGAGVPTPRPTLSSTGAAGSGGGTSAPIALLGVIGVAIALLAGALVVRRSRRS